MSRKNGRPRVTPDLSHELVAPWRNLDLAEDPGHIHPLTNEENHDDDER